MTNGGNVLEYKCGNKSLLSFIIIVDNKLYKIGFRGIRNVSAVISRRE